MKVLDVLLDTKPTAKAVMEMAELRIRNLLCFRELQSFNDSGKWLQKHPLITHRSAYSRLEELFALDHTRFMDEYNRCCCNISRYECTSHFVFIKVFGANPSLVTDTLEEMFSVIKETTGCNPEFEQ